MENKRYLIDTHILLWYLSGDKSLPINLFNIIKDKNNEILVSVVVLWEILIKKNIGKLEIPDGIEIYIEKSGFEFISLDVEHVINLSGLQSYHKDPFDRILIAQAIAEDIPIISTDSQISKYKVEVIS